MATTFVSRSLLIALLFSVGPTACLDPPPTPLLPVAPLATPEPSDTWPGSQSAIVTPTHAPPPAATRASAPLPPIAEKVFPGIPLQPGQQLTFHAPNNQAGALLLANPSAISSVLAVDIEPRCATISPNDCAAEPDASPGMVSPAPAPSLRPPPFGFRPDTVRIPITGRRRVMAAASVELPPPQRLGSQTTFWINNGDAAVAGDRLRPATLRHVSDHAYFYVDEAGDTPVAQTEVLRLADAFERQIRPAIVPLFGEEARPGIDGDPRLYVVLSPWVGAAPGRSSMMGYFWPRDPVPQGGSGQELRQHANEKEVLFLATPILDQPDVTAFGTLAHEYQHLIMFCARAAAADGTDWATEDTWLDEGFSMLAMDVAGYGLVGGDKFVQEEINAFQREPGAYSLTDWTSNPNGYSYGLSYMFVRYLVDQFGPGLIREVQTERETGTKGLDAILERRGEDFGSVFLEWAQANRPATQESPTATQAASGNGLPSTMPLLGTQAIEPTGATSLRVRPWGVTYLEWAGAPGAERTLTLQNASAPLQIFERPMPPNLHRPPATSLEGKVTEGR